MKEEFEQEFRLDKPETIGETDKIFDLYNYKDWLELKLTESRKEAMQYKHAIDILKPNDLKICQCGQNKLPYVANLDTLKCSRCGEQIKK